MLSYPKHSCFRFAALTLRVQGSQNGVSLCLPCVRGGGSAKPRRKGCPLSREITLGMTTPQALRASSPLRTETPLWDVPVFRMAYWDKRAHCALLSQTLMLQVRCANPAGTGEPKRRILMPPLCSRRASEASLEFERLAQPKSRTERQRAARRDGAKREVSQQSCDGGVPLLQNLPPERREARRRRASRQECGLRPAKGRGAHSCPPKPLGRKTHTTRTRRIT